MLRFCKPEFKVSIIKQILACGTPNFLNTSAGRITAILMNIVLLHLGGENAVAVYGVLMYAEGVVLPILYGMCDSLQPAVGYNWGAGNYNRVKAIEKRVFAASGIVSVLAAVIMFCIPEQITNLFMPDTDAAFVTVAVKALQLFSLTYLTRWFSFAVQSFMLAVEKPVPASIISVSTALIFPVLLIIALWPFGLNGLWLNFATTAVLAAVLGFVILMKFLKDSHQMRNGEISGGIID